MKKWGERTAEEIMESINRVQAELAAETFSSQFQIIKKLENGQLFCRNKQDGTLTILNDWRIK